MLYSAIMTDDYFAGLFDGEGTLRISFNGRQYQLLAQLGLSGAEVPEPLRVMQDRYGGWIEYRSNAGTPWKPVWVWRASSKGVLALLDSIAEKLIIKREHARVAYEFQALLTHRSPVNAPEKVRLFERMRELNAKGR